METAPVLLQQKLAAPGGAFPLAVRTTRGLKFFAIFSMIFCTDADTITP
jgi:hypothetical protein